MSLPMGITIVSAVKFIFKSVARPLKGSQLLMVKGFFLTDRSPIHCKFAGDALNARTMNVKPGGRQVALGNPRCVIFGSYRTKVERRRAWYSLLSVQCIAASLRVYGRLVERDLEQRPSPGSDMRIWWGCCRLAKISRTRRLSLKIRPQRGDVVIFGVRFHPELAAPVPKRVSNTLGLSKRSKDRVEGAQDAEDLTIELICKHFSRADPKSSDQHASISHSIEKENH